MLVNHTLTLEDYIRQHVQWSKEAFGEGDHLAGLLKHIEKEVEEVREVAPASKELVVRELVDIVILTIDAIWRMGLYPDEVAQALVEKQAINMGRSWPRISDPNEPTEHIKSEDNHE